MMMNQKVYMILERYTLRVIGVDVYEVKREFFRYRSVMTRIE
jgi:hypothetical protein